MRKTIIIICTTLSLLIILDSMNAGNALLLFLFAGVVPGTNLLVSPVDMMAAMATAITIVILRIALWPFIREFLDSQPTQTPSRTKRTHRRTA